MNREPIEVDAHARARAQAAGAATIALLFGVWAALLYAAWASNWPISLSPQPVHDGHVVGIRVAQVTGPGQTTLTQPEGAPAARCDDDSVPAPGRIHAHVEPDGRTVRVVQDLVCT